MMKEMNHRFGFYLVSTLMIVMLLFLYSDVKGLSNDVDALLESAQNDVGLDPVFLQQLQDQRELQMGVEGETETTETMNAEEEADMEDVSDEEATTEL